MTLVTSNMCCYGDGMIAVVIIMYTCFIVSTLLSAMSQPARERGNMRRSFRLLVASGVFLVMALVALVALVRLLTMD